MSFVKVEETKKNIAYATSFKNHDLFFWFFFGSWVFGLFNIRNVKLEFKRISFNAQDYFNL